MQTGIGYGAVRAQYKNSRLSIPFLFVKEKVISLRRFTTQTCQHRKCQVVLSHQLLAILRGIGADGDNLGVLLLKLGQLLLKGVDLEVAKGSPFPPVEKKYRLLTVEVIIQTVLPSMSLMVKSGALSPGFNPGMFFSSFL